MSQSGRFEATTMSPSEREAFLQRVSATTSPEDCRRIEAMSRALPQILALIEQDPMTMRKLLHLLFGARTEKTDRVCPPATAAAPVSAAAKPKRKGHGRTTAKDYTGARWVEISHPQVERAGGAGRERVAVGECELRGEEQLAAEFSGVRAGSGCQTQRAVGQGKEV